MLVDNLILYKNMKLNFSGIFLQIMLINLEVSLCEITKLERLANLTNYFENDVYIPGKILFIDYMMKIKDSSHKTDSKLKKECLRNDFGFTNYHKLVYVFGCCSTAETFYKMCNLSTYSIKRMKLKVLCHLVYNSTKEQKDFQTFKIEIENDQRLIQNCYALKNYLEIRDLLKSVLKSNFSLRFGRVKGFRFFENVVEDIPFCKSFSCPFWIASNTTQNYFSSLYDCMPYSCQIAFWAVVMVDAILTVLIITANLIIIIVVFNTPCLLTPQGYFSLSLAVADIIVGVVIEPCVVYNFISTYRLSSTSSIPSTSSTTSTNENVLFRNISGFFTGLSLCASLLSLIGTSIFRFVAVKKPHSYWRYREQIKKATIKTIILIWILSAFLGLIPIIGFIPEDRYFLHPVGLTLSLQMDNLYIYVGNMAFGLILIWTLTLSSYAIMRRVKNVRKNNRKKKESISIPPPSGSKKQTHFKKLERSLNSTLRLVVIAFTLSYLPLSITQCFSKTKSINLKKHPREFDPDVNFAWNVAMFVSSRFVISNSFVNCIIYNIKSKEFLNAAKRIFLKYPRVKRHL